MSIWKTLSYLQDLLNSKNLCVYFSAVIYQPHAELFHQYNFKLQNNCLIRATFLPLLLLLFLLSNLPSPSQWPQFPSPTPFSPLCSLPSVSLTPTVSLDRMAKRDLQALTLYLGQIAPLLLFHTHLCRLFHLYRLFPPNRVTVSSSWPDKLLSTFQ